MRCELLRGPVGLSAFAPAVADWLARDPVRRNIIATIVGMRADGTVPVEPDSVWALLRDERGVVAAALWTPPHPLLVPDLEPDAARALLDALLDVGYEPNGVNGPTGGSTRVAEAWRARTGGVVTPGLGTRLHVLGTLTPPVDVPGRLIRADWTYRTHVTRYVVGFESDAFGAASPSAERTVDEYLANGFAWLWEVKGEPVSMAAYRPPANGVYRISGVYTPPERRRHGYAAAAVAELGRHLRDVGANDVVLYTDVANPTSNGVYERIGFTPVSDATTWTFTPS